MSTTKLLSYVERRIKAQEATINKWLGTFQERLADGSFRTSPAYAMEWSTDMFAASASLDVLKSVRSLLESGSTVEDIRNELTSLVMHASKYPPCSSSVPSNLVAQYKLAAQADLLSELRFLSE